MRWNAYNIDNPPFNIEELAKDLEEMYDINTDVYLSKYSGNILDVEIEFINSWLFHGLNTIRDSLE
jgi:hypothetical protein